MHKYVEKAKEMIAQLNHIEVQPIPKAQNMKADALSKLASSDSFCIQRTSTIDVPKEKSIEDKGMTVNRINQHGEMVRQVGSIQVDRRTSRESNVS